MTDLAFTTVNYKGQSEQVSWSGVVIDDGDDFKSFMVSDVASRLIDQEGSSEFEVYLRGLASTGFACDSLKAILEAEVSEEYDWAVCEAVAEAYLESEHGIIWPWNMKRDKRNPCASLPGADLVGFKVTEGKVQLALGEVKSSTDANAPPSVMNGRGGMVHQIESLANNLSLICQLLKWLLPRCKGTIYEKSFNEAVGLLLSSGNRSIALFGILIRDTKPTEQDLQTRGRYLGEILQPPITCNLIALYLSFSITDMPARVLGDRQ